MVFGSPSKLWAASAANVLLVTERTHDNRVVEGTDTASVQRPHVEDVDALHLAENFQTLQTGSLLKVGRDGTGGTTRREKVVLILDLRQRSQELVLLAGLRVAFPWVVKSPNTSGKASPCDGGRAEGRGPGPRSH